LPFLSGQFTAPKYRLINQNTGRPAKALSVPAVMTRKPPPNSGETQNLPTDGHGFISSLEAGYPIPLPFGPHFVLEPQAQMRQQVTFDDANGWFGRSRLDFRSDRAAGSRGQWTLDGHNGTFGSHM
jgi:hypothetical protein